MNQIPVEIKLLHDNFKNNIWELPNYATNGSAAFDLLAAIDVAVDIEPFKTILIPSGLSIWIKDPDYVLVMAPRSGKGCKSGIVLGNTIGVIDSDYQGPLMMCIYNRSETTIRISPGEHIAQALIVEVYHMSPTIVTEFSNITERGENGFGSTK
jgi:dUTP pyrophosphatase